MQIMLASDAVRPFIRFETRAVNIVTGKQIGRAHV